MPPTQLHHPSPKRKRDQPPPIPLLNTALRPASTPPRGSPAPASGADSPRNAVADQLRGMTLTSIAAIPVSPLTPVDEVVHKKPKLDETSADSGASLTQDHAKADSIFWRNGNRLDTIAVMPPVEAQATQPHILPDIASFTRPTTFMSSPEAIASQQHQVASRRPHTHNRSSSQPRPRNKSPSPPLSLLTWKDTEITGHLVDPSTDPDDDGTGLNGIGFKPTPAIAYARSQRRRQQLNEWKARETREARAKRSERRRRGVGGTVSREATVETELPSKHAEASKRTVKFAE